MGVMSDLDILADNVRDAVQNSSRSVSQAIDDVAAESTYDKDDIRWAFKEKHVPNVRLEESGNYVNVMYGDDVIASIWPETGEFVAYDQEQAEPRATIVLDVV